MPNFLVVSARAIYTEYADACSFEFEDAIIDSLQADLLELSNIPSVKTQTTGENRDKYNKEYDIVFLVANNFRKLAKMYALLEKYKIPAKKTYAYVFGAYIHELKYLTLPGARHFIPRYRRICQIDHIFVPFKENQPVLANLFDLPFHYSPMAVDVLKVAGDHPSRFISVNGFGRQEPMLNDLLAATFNKPGSPYIYQHTNAIISPGMKNWQQYRELFWHSLRNSQLSLTFDSLYHNPNGRSQHSFVGPRWYESLAAGAVVVGQSPKTEEALALLDWRDATIDLPDDPERALKKIMELLDSPDDLRQIGNRNTQQMFLKHDWRYRIEKMLIETGFPRVQSLDRQIQELKERSKNIAQSDVRILKTKLSHSASNL
ncbi:MAG: glycosyltransferase family 1 protein [Sneathiella sp.]|nr:glycosyltransferase family 1 protein [Sneathiella sp.]